MKKVVFSPYVESDLLRLIDILIEEGYISTYPFAVNYINDLVDYIVSNLPSSFHKNAPSFFSKYGSNLKYIISLVSRF